MCMCVCACVWMCMCLRACVRLFVGVPAWYVCTLLYVCVYIPFALRAHTQHTRSRSHLLSVSRSRAWLSPLTTTCPVPLAGQPRINAHSVGWQEQVIGQFTD
jgi:hypothetical protein